MTRVSRFVLPISLSLVLAGCGSHQSLSQVVAQPKAEQLTVGTPAPENLASSQVTDLAQTYPSSRPLTSQGVDKSVPIVLVHGAAGFGRDEFGGVIKYWGGVYDVQEDLRAQGYKVFTVSVGPISSTWDRAAEAYAQIKGGCVDYGAEHSAKFSHTRSDPAKCYPGFYPEWDAQHPVNLIGHSMGVATSRLLIKLLEEGDASNAQDNNLFTGGCIGWVKNMMGISGPSMGSTAIDTYGLDVLKTLLLAIGASANVTGSSNVYDFDLGQFGLDPQLGEPFEAYVDRVFNSPLVASKDSAYWDIQPDGAVPLNRYIGRSPNVKYFTWATYATNPDPLTGWEYPDATMATPLVGSAYPYPRPAKPGMGNVYGSSTYGAVQYDSTWWANDGLVPSNYMDAPTDQVTLNYTGQPTVAGQWYALGRLNGWDHTDITGLLTTADVRPFYRNQAAFLNSQ